MARCNQVGLHGAIRAVAPGEGVGDQPTVTVGRVWVGLCDFGAE
jgi:hypothetical protein